MSSPARSTSSWPRVSAHGGREGALAALLALFLDLLWRTTAAPAGAPSLPDTVVAKTREKYLEAYRRLTGHELP